MKRRNNSGAHSRPSRNTNISSTNNSASGKKEYRKRDDKPKSERSDSASPGRRFNVNTGERPVSKKRASSTEDKPFKRNFSARKENDNREAPKRRFEARDKQDDFQKRKDSGDEQRKDERISRPFNRRGESTPSKSYTRRPKQEEDIKPRRNIKPSSSEEKSSPRFRKRDNEVGGDDNSNKRTGRTYSSRREESSYNTNTNRRRPSTRSDFDKKEDKSFSSTKPKTRDEKRSTGRERIEEKREKPAFDTQRRNKPSGNAGAEERPQRIPFQNDGSGNRRGPRGAKSAPDYDFKKYESRRKFKKEKEDKEGQLIRLNRYIANAGVCSRRDADSLIEAGEIKVNGKVVTEMGYQIGPNDIVKYGNRVLNKEKLVYVLLNKPKDFITTTDDPDERKTVMDLVKNACEQRIYPVGRLDRNTTGLLLLTNDGEVAEKLSHPSNDVKKIYQVELDKPITEKDFEKIMAGVELEDGKATVDDMAIVSPDATVLGLEIHIGRNRIVRRIFEHLGYEVVKLDRVSYAGLTKKDLPRGQWRFLTEKEVVKLKYFI